jgi:hypothetical protein
LPATDRDAVKAIAESRGLKVKHAPGILAEAWKLLSQEQVAVACERYAASRRPSRRAKASA